MSTTREQETTVGYDVEGDAENLVVNPKGVQQSLDRAEKELVKHNLHRGNIKESMILSAFISVLFFVLIGIGYLVIKVVSANPGILQVSVETIETLRRAVDSIILLITPFVFGFLGGLARVLVAGVSFSKHIGVLTFSGLLAAFSWIGLKSKIVLSLLAAFLNSSIEKSALNAPEAANLTSSLDSGSESAFYSMLLVAVIVGMFSSNIFIIIEQRVKQATSGSRSD